MRSLNADHNKTISDLEAAFIVVEKLLKKHLQDHPNSGMILCKGKPNETRIRYSEVTSVLHSIQIKLSQEGCFSFGVCKTCARFNPSVSQIGCFGMCNNSKIVHEYDSCDKHSKRGGGYGL